MVGRTNAILHSLVSSVNGMTGAVTLDANINFNSSETYENNTVGKALQAPITSEAIDAFYGGNQLLGLTMLLNSGVENNGLLGSSSEGDNSEEENNEELSENPEEEPVEEPTEEGNSTEEEPENEEEEGT